MNALANFFTRLIGRYPPDPFVIAIGLTFLTLVLAMLIEGTTPVEAAVYWGDSFWNLLAFSMQMTVILLAGYLLAKSPPVNAALVYLVSKVEGPGCASGIP